MDASEEQSDSEKYRSMRKVKRQHIDHIAEKGYVGSFHYGLAHKPVSLQEAMMIPEARAAVDKTWDQFKKLTAWEAEKVKCKAEVARQAKERLKNNTLREPE